MKQDWALFIWNEKSKQFYLIMLDQELSKMKIKKETYQLAKILLQLLIEPFRKTKYIKRNNSTIIIKYIVVHWTFIGRSSINNCNRLNKQRRKS